MSVQLFTVYSKRFVGQLCSEGLFFLASLYLHCHLWMMEEDRSNILNSHCVPVEE